MIDEPDNDRFTYWMTRIPEWSELGGFWRGVLISVGLFVVNFTAALLIALGIGELREDDWRGGETMGTMVFVVVVLISLLDAIAILTINRPRRDVRGSLSQFLVIVVLMPFTWFVPMILMFLAMLIHST